MILLIIMSDILCNYFITKEYQEIAEIIQNNVFYETDSKKFADMHLKYDLLYTHKSLMEIITETQDFSVIQEKLRTFVQEFFTEEDERNNIPYLRIVSTPLFANNLPPNIREVYKLIQNKWYMYARRDSYKYPKEIYSSSKGINVLPKNNKPNYNAIRSEKLDKHIINNKLDLPIGKVSGEEDKIDPDKMNSDATNSNKIDEDKMKSETGNGNKVDPDKMSSDAINSSKIDKSKERIENDTKKSYHFSDTINDLKNRLYTKEFDFDNSKYNMNFPDTPESKTGSLKSNQTILSEDMPGSPESDEATDNNKSIKRDESTESPKNNVSSNNTEPLNDETSSKVKSTFHNILEGNKKEQIITNSPDNDFISNRITLPHLYFVPGGRFKEAYYWDSYWILIGLLSCNMKENAFELVQSFAFLIKQYGYVPNGTRKYYIGRSQPPFFSQMLFRLYKANVHRTWILEEGLPALEKEYDWWMNNRHFDEKLKLNRYKVEKYNIPRPEAYKEDKPYKNKYKDIWAAAESGWDFSTRWFKDKENLSSICTGDIIPVDLNVLMLMNERVIVLLNQKKLERIEEREQKQKRSFLDIRKSSWRSGEEKSLGSESLRETSTAGGNADGKRDHADGVRDHNKATVGHHAGTVRDHDGNKEEDQKESIKSKIEIFSKNILEREAAIKSVLWNKEEKVWLDYNTETKTHNKAFYFSNIMPLFLNVEIPEGNLYNILYLYKEELFGYKGGIPASNVKSSDSENKQQWDFPNVWAPLVQMFTEYMLDIEYPLALHAANSFFRSVYWGMGTNRNFHEKYHCQLVGEKGKGGEYESQEGFGWTNGTIAWMIEVFGDKLTIEDDHKESYEKIVHLINSKKQTYKEEK